MSEMVERVAKALYIAEIGPAIGPFDWDIDEAGEVAARNYRKMARAAIEAMREPTEAMVRAGGDVTESDAIAIATWHAMIDEAIR